MVDNSQRSLFLTSFTIGFQWTEDTISGGRCGKYRQYITVFEGLIRPRKVYDGTFKNGIRTVSANIVLQRLLRYLS